MHSKRKARRKTYKIPVSNPIKDQLDNLELQLAELSGVCRCIEGKLEMLCDLLQDEEDGE